MLPLFPQELPTSCVAACVRMVLTGLGYPLSEADIRERCGHTSLGMQLNQIGNGLRGLPVTVDYHIDWNIDDLIEAASTGINPIVGVDLRPVEGLFAFHAVVVVTATREHILVYDPRYDKAPLTMQLSTFESAWTSADCEAVTIRGQT